MNLVPIWKDAQARVIDLCSQASDQDAAKTVPATPDWTVHDLVAHMTGVDADITAGTAPPAPTDEWTASHVAQRQSMALTDVVNEWHTLEPKVVETLQSGPDEAKGNIIGDVSTHEQDLRGALNMPGARDHQGMKMSLQAFIDMFSDRVTEAGLPAVHIIAGDTECTAGEGMAEVTLTADPFELHRALTGRRSANQVRSMDWAGDPEPYLPVFSFSGSLRDTDLVE